LDDPITEEERAAWWQAFNQSVQEWRLWEQWWATEGQRQGIEPKRRHEFKHYLDFEYGRTLARERLPEGETETYIDRAINEQRSHNQRMLNWMHGVQDGWAAKTEEFNQPHQRRWGRYIQIGIFAALGLVVVFGLIRSYWP
jgi:hypothetical protein